MEVHSNSYHRGIASIAIITTVLCSATLARADIRLYTGSIQIRLHSGPGSVYSIPLGAEFSYPRMDNLPAGDYATTSGSAPQRVRLAPNQLTRKTSVSTLSPPSPWYKTLLRTRFSGGNGTGTFSAGRAPGPATSAPVTSVSGSRFGISFSGTPTQYGGTMQLLANYSARYNLWNSAELPLGVIGGSFGGKLTDTGFQGGTGFSPTFFTESVWGFPWTTGTVMAAAPPHPYFTGSTTTVSLTAMGSDLRTPQGSGSVRLVSPFVVRKREQGSSALLQARAGVAIVSLRFAPEPSAIAQLVAGLLALAALYHFSYRITER